MADEMDIFLDDFAYEDEVTVEDDESKKVEEKEDNLEEEKETQVEEKEVKKKQPDAPPNGSDKKDSTSNILSSIASVIQEEGYFELNEGEALDIKTPEDFLKVFDKVKENALQSEMIDWSEEQKEYFKAANSGVPHDTIVRHQQKQDAYSSITEDAIEKEENEDLRKQILVANLLSKNFSHVERVVLLLRLLQQERQVRAPLHMVRKS